MDDIHKSCDRCRQKKRKCSGEKPCSRCGAKGVACVYSNRRPRESKKKQVALLHARDSASHPILPQHAQPTLKRCRMSASPATGLVGMQENEFLSDFFGSLEFMQFTTKSDIRETMMKIILPNTLQQSVLTPDCGEEKSIDTIVPGKGFGAVMGLSGPSACTFWCAVGIGSLVQGRPIESVENYLRLANAALATFSGPPNPDMVKAWMILSYFCGLMGDQEKFHEYLAPADAFLSDCSEKEANMLPVGLAEVIKTVEIVKLFDGSTRPEEVESLPAQDVPRPQADQLTTVGELCQHVFRSCRVFERRFISHIVRLGRTPIGYEYVNEAKADADSASESLTASRASGGAGSLLSPAALDDLLGVLECRMLEQAADSPIVASGIGGLVMNDRLLFERTAKGDVLGALERVERIVEIYERYPGLNRFCISIHKTHIIVALLVAIGSPRAKKLYSRIRSVENLALLPGRLQVPPWDEWRGVSSICANEACRSAASILTGEDVTPTPRSPPPWLETNEECLKVADNSERRRDRYHVSATSEYELSVRERSFDVIDASFASRQTAMMETDEPSPQVRSDPKVIGDGGGNDLGSMAPPSHENVGQCVDQSIGGSGAPVLSREPVELLMDEVEQERVGAEDWLEAVHALGSSEPGSFLGLHGILGWVHPRSEAIDFVLRFCLGAWRKRPF